MIIEIKYFILNTVKLFCLAVILICAICVQPGILLAEGSASEEIVRMLTNKLNKPEENQEPGKTQTRPKLTAPKPIKAEPRSTSKPAFLPVAPPEETSKTDTSVSLPVNTAKDTLPKRHVLGSVETNKRGLVRGDILPRNQSLVSALVDGRLDTIKFRDGETVSKGDTIAVMTVMLEAVDILLPTEKNDAVEKIAADQHARFVEQDVHAPVSGIVTEVFAKTGSVISRGAPILEIMEEGEFELSAIVPSDWISKVEPGRKILIYVQETGKRYEAEVERFGGKIDSEAKSIRMYGSFIQPDKDLRPGMSGFIAFRPLEGDKK